MPFIAVAFVSSVLVTQGTSPWVVSAASLPLPTGAATSALQTTGNTLLAGGLPAALGAGGGLKIDGSGTALPVSGTVTGNQGAAAALSAAWPVELSDGTNLLGVSAHPVRTDPTGTTAQPVSWASAQHVIVDSATVGAVNQGTAAALSAGWPVELSDGTNLLGVSAHPVRVDPTGTTPQPVSGTVTANIGTSGSLALEGGNLATIAGRTPALGQALAAASVPVVLPVLQDVLAAAGAAPAANIPADALMLGGSDYTGTPKLRVPKVDSTGLLYVSSVGTVTEANSAAIKTDLDSIVTNTGRIPSSPSTDRTTAAAPFAVELSDGTSFYVGAKTGQLPTGLGQALAAASLPVVLTVAQDVIGNAGAAPAANLPTDALLMGGSDYGSTAKVRVPKVDSSGNVSVTSTTLALETGNLAGAKTDLDTIVTNTGAWTSSGWLPFTRSGGVNGIVVKPSAGVYTGLLPLHNVSGASVYIQIHNASSLAGVNIGSAGTPSTTMVVGGSVTIANATDQGGQAIPTGGINCSTGIVVVLSTTDTYVTDPGTAGSFAIVFYR